MREKNELEEGKCRLWVCVWKTGGGLYVVKKVASLECEEKTFN